MRHIIFALIFAFSTSAALAQSAKPLELAPDAPERHIVVPGDTLWGIAAKFLKDPFRWPELWKMNAEQVRNPHRIYPGQVLILDLSGGQPQLKLATLKLSPKVRAEALGEAIPAIPASAIEPFLSQPLVINPGEFDTSPRIVATQEDRVFTGTGDKIYATNNADPKIKRWHVFRPGRPLVDPDSKEVLGIEAVYLGSARPDGEPGDVLPLVLTSVKQEIGRGDYLVPAERPEVMSYVPHAPTQDINGRVMLIYGGVGEGAVNSVVSLSRGKQDGLEVGHVVAIYRAGSAVTNRFEDDKPQTHLLPDERIGLAFVFRVFDRVSYALITSASRPVMEGDRIHKP
ncbi:LysM peptidoglycan-binding domain-containing protein [Sulfuricystis multivorans]|uniref:LysM peptidoglycan-binding domain-containing protein n=1 Tax=Sulfuricystis multivorans TaxID=2211108 RepID=UPI000F839E4D|nr:LysM domain-containing protein [Sulfuricystis multivorans]